MPAKTNATPITIDRRGTRCSITIEKRNLMLCNYRFEDRWFLSNGKIMGLVNAERSDSEFYVEGIELVSQTNYFTKPFNSSLMNIYLANIDATSEFPRKVKVSEIDCKFICIEEECKNYVFIPILHTEKI